MLLASNPTLATHPDSHPNSYPTSGPITTEVSPQATVSQTLKPPQVLIILLLFLILQILLCIGVLIVKIIFNYFGFNELATLAVDQTTCTDYPTVTNYELKQLYIMKISLVMICVALLCSIVSLVVVSVFMHRSRQLSPQLTSTLQLATLYKICGPKTRAFLYILQSISLLGIIVVLGYYLTYFINFQLKSCPWVNPDDTNTKIIVVCALAAAAFIFAWIVWIIIVMINLKNRNEGQLKYLDEEKKQYQNVNNTEVNNTQENHEQTKAPLKQQPKNQGGYYRHYDPLLNKQGQKVDNINRVGTLDSQKQGYVIRAPHEGSNNKKSYLYKSPGTPTNEVEKNTQPYGYARKDQPKPYSNSYNNQLKPSSNSYENPVFGSRKELYDSPYNRIQNGKYYEGERDKNNQQLKAEMQAIEEHEKDKEFRRSRYNQNPDRFSPKKDDENYLRSLSRYRLEHEQKQYFKPNQSRQILPESNSHASGANSYQGASRPKLHSTYFKDENAMLNKKKNENSDEKRKRKGILNDYIRGKYVDN